MGGVQCAERLEIKQLVMHVHQPVDDGIDLVHDEDWWISRYKGIKVHVEVRWGRLVSDLLSNGRGCGGIRHYLQTVVMKLEFGAEPFGFRNCMVCVR